MSMRTEHHYEALTQRGEEKLAREDFLGAEKHFRDALVELERLGPTETHGLIAIGQMNLATVLIRQSQFTEAEDLLNRSLNVIVQKKGLEHPLFVYGLRQLADVLAQQKQRDQSERLYQWVLEIGESQLGPNHPGLIKPLQALLECYTEWDETEKAKELSQRLEAIEHNPTRWRVYLTEGTEAYAEKDWFRAEVCFDNALSFLRERPEGGSLDDVARLCHNLASVLKKVGKMSQAEPLAREALDHYEKLHGSEAPLLSAPLKNLAEILEDSGQEKAAKTVLNRLKKLKK